MLIRIGAILRSCGSAYFHAGEECDALEFDDLTEFSLDTGRIDYISLGTLKPNKLLYEAIKKRFPDSETILGEIFPSGDGKYKYLKFLRIEVYKKMISWIRGFDSGIRIELSLEPDDTYKLVFPAERVS